MIATDDVPRKPIGQAAEAAVLRQEAVMGQAIPRQHPAVVLRSHFNQLRALLAVAIVAVVGLTAAVVILATNDDASTSGGSANALSGLSPAEKIRVEALSNLSPAQIAAALGHAPQATVTPETEIKDEAGAAAAIGQARGNSELRAGEAQSPASPSQSPTKDYSLNGATGDVAPEPQAQTGSRSDGSSDDTLPPGSGYRTN
jgi:hypothetical protein